MNPLQGWSRECCFAVFNQSPNIFHWAFIEYFSNPSTSQSNPSTYKLLEGSRQDKTTDKRTRSTKTTLSLLTHSPGRPTGNQVNVFPTRSLRNSHWNFKIKKKKILWQVWLYSIQHSGSLRSSFDLKPTLNIPKQHKLKHLLSCFYTFISRFILNTEENFPTAHTAKHSLTSSWVLLRTLSCFNFSLLFVVSVCNFQQTFLHIESHWSVSWTKLQVQRLKDCILMTWLT